MKIDSFPRIVLSRPLISAVILYIAGLYLGRNLRTAPLLSLDILSLCSLLLLAVFFSFKSRLPYFILLLFFPLGLFLSQANGFIYDGTENVTSFAGRGHVVVEGVVLERSDEGPSKRFLIESSTVFTKEKVLPLKGRILLTLEEGGKNIVPGLKVRFMAKLKVPRNFGNPGGFDYEGYLHERGIYGTAFLKKDDSLAVIGKGSPFRELIYSYREKVSRAIGESSLKESRGIIAAISIGDRGYIEESLMTAFRKSGVAHLLAISGLHMGIVAFFFFALFRWLLARSERVLLYNMAGKVAAILTLLPLTIYLLASGMSTSAVRAYIMVVVFLFSVIMERESQIYNTIALAALLILFIWPLALFEVGFQLSFIAVLSIVYIVPRIERFFKISDGVERSWRTKILTFIIVSFAASLGTAPLTAFYFTEISFSSVISNLLIIPLAGFVAVPLSALALFFSLFSMEAAKAMFFAASAVMELPILLTRYISSIPHSSTIVVPPAGYELFIYYILLVLIFSSLRKVAFSAMLIVPLIFMYSRFSGADHYESPGKLEVTFISVGQGESTFIRFPRGKTMLIDGGGVYDNAFDLGRMVLRPFLLTRAVKKLDYIVITHPHPDHMYGLLHIVSEFDVGELWLNGMPPVDGIYREILAVSGKKGIEKKVKNDSSPDLEIDDVRLAFLHPAPAGRMKLRSGSDINNGSIVMKLTYGNKSFLFTGDLEKAGEKRLLEANYDLKADVVKVAHHGSLTSSAMPFVKAVSPGYAVFSVGYNNRFHFPKNEIVKRYRNAGSLLLRTDESGAVTFLTDGKELRLKTFR